jgi:hypothetical protein
MASPTTTALRLPLDPVACHRAQTDRLAALTGFLASFAPAIGESREGFREPADREMSLVALRARDRAVRLAFRAVGRIAARS